MSQYLSPNYEEYLNGDLAVTTALPPAIEFGVDLTVQGTTGLDDVDEVWLDVIEVAATSYHPWAPETGSTIHITMAVASATFFDFIVYDESLNILFRQLDDNITTTGPFIVDATFAIPETGNLQIEWLGFEGALTHNPVAYTLTIDGTSAFPSPTVPVASFLPVSTSILEGSNPASPKTYSITVKLDHASNQPVYIGYHLDSGSATLADYTPVDSVLTFAPGVTTQTIQVQIVGDTHDEPIEQFQIVLDDSQTADLPLGASTLPITISIIDDDGTGQPESWSDVLPQPTPPTSMDWDSPNGASISPTFGFDPATGRWLLDLVSNVSEWTYDTIRDVAIAEVVGAFEEQAQDYIDELGRRLGVTNLYQQVQQAQQVHDALVDLHTNVFTAMTDGLEGDITADVLNSRIDAALSRFSADVTGISAAAEDALGAAGVAIIDFIFGPAGSGNVAYAAPTGERFRLEFTLPGDALSGGTARDALLGGGAGDLMYGYAGDDLMYGGLGNDTMYGGDNADIMYGGTGNDTSYGGTGADTVNGEDGNDTLSGDAGNDAINGGDGYDNLYGGADADTIHGGANEDIIVGDAGNDFLYGDDGNDVLSELFDPVNSGNDTLDGGNGIDIMYAAAGNDVVYGGTDGANNYASLGDGDDVYRGSNGTDVVQGGAGSDTIWGWNNGGNDGDDSLYGEDGNDTVEGGTGIDLVSGGAGDDKLYGGDGNDLLVADDGNDTLSGGFGIDVMYGGAGNDTFNCSGDLSVDAMYGGAGNDTYELSNGGIGTDYIWDFQGGAGASDQIRYISYSTSPLITAISVSSQYTSSGNYYVNFSDGSHVVLVGVTSLLAEDLAGYAYTPGPFP